MIDGLKGFVITDDKSQNFVGGRPDYRWEYAAKGQGYMTIEIREAEHEVGE